jgi:hypothetical protein
VLSQGSVTIGYNDVRHTAVPIEQFLPELVLGAWLGSLDEKTLRFASGDDSNVTPRHIFVGVRDASSYWVPGGYGQPSRMTAAGPAVHMVSRSNRIRE